MYDGCPYKIVSVFVIAEVLARPLTMHDFTKFKLNNYVWGFFLFDIMYCANL